jgi:hypothetical protein
LHLGPSFPLSVLFSSIKSNPQQYRVQDEKEDTSVIDEVFQASELVEPYRIAPSIDLEENYNFHVFDDSLIDVDAKELNVVLSFSGLENVDEEDDNHIKECDEADNNSIKDEDENSD